MGDVADDMMEEARRWAEESTMCIKHGMRHLNDQPCTMCEDGVADLRPLNRVCTYKKYKSSGYTWRRVCQIDYRYAQWCARNVDNMDDDLRSAIYALDPGDNDGVDDDLSPGDFGLEY